MERYFQWLTVVRARGEGANEEAKSALTYYLLFSPICGMYVYIQMKMITDVHVPPISTNKYTPIRIRIRIKISV